LKTFLDSVVKKILESNFELDKIKIIVPNNRSILYLKKAFMDLVERPLFSPEIQTIESFVEKLSGLKPISKTELLFNFFQIYMENTPEKEIESFEQFFDWASMVLKEFNEIDANLISAKEIFEYNLSLKKIDEWGNNSDTELIRQNLKFNNKIYDLYQFITSKLINKQLGYRGMIYKEANNNIGHYLEINKFHHYFVGLNALNQAEENIIQEIISTKKASVIWDIDEDFIKDKFHPSGHFIRNYIKNWKHLNKSKINFFSSSFKSKKHIEVIETPNNLIQAKSASQILNKLAKKFKESKTVLVLGEESILSPVLSAVSKTEESYNVTMGYPLIQTEVSQIINQFIMLHKKAKGEKFFLFDIISLIELFPISGLFGSIKLDLMKFLKQNELLNNGFILIDKILEISGVHRLGIILFKPFTSVLEFLKRTIEFCSISINYLNKIDKKKYNLIIFSYEKFQIIIEKIIAFEEKKSFIKNLDELTLILNSIIKFEKINFNTDSFNNVQIMGLLETRLLDFENVIITNLNEGVLPSGNIHSNLFPFEVRKKFKLPTFLDHDLIYAHHFFRLLKRAKNIYLLYNSSSQGLFSGEKSRFLYQLDFFRDKEHKILFKKVNFNYLNKIKDQDSIVKSEIIYKELILFAEKGFSPSSLIQYIRNPYDFYEERLLGIKRPDNFDNTINYMDKGTIIHKVLENLYKPYLNKDMEINNYSDMLNNLESNLFKEYKKLYNGENIKVGSNYITFEIMRKLIQNFLKKEKETISKGNKIKIISIEEKFNKSLDIKGLNFPINIKGTVDRIDVYNNTLRIIDYKSGVINKSNLSFKDWNSIVNDEKKSALFQVLIYSYVFRDKIIKNKEVQAGVIPFNNYNNEFIPVSLLENNLKRCILNLDDENLENFEKQFFSVIYEIFDKKKPFLKN
tara:strand:- start:3935 stop:6673 length:2739 start_codon:yes stop_codon:yes gene_type:complete